jgi:PGF-CTERM protein
MEGVGFNPNAPEYLYLAMSDVRNDMTDGQGDIKVTQNRCGIVYRMTLDDEWNVNRIEPVISGGPYTSSATYECDVDNLAGPDNLAVLDDGRVLVGEDTDKHENNMVWLWELSVEPEIEEGEGGPGGESIAVNHVVKVDTPLHPEWKWNYSYQVEVSDLQMDVNYTAVIGIVRIEDMSWEGLEWWWDIDWEGGYDEDNDGFHNQSNNTFSLSRGCYHINADLYESNGDIENSAPLGSPGDLDFGVGGTCLDGTFYPEIVDSDSDGVVDFQDNCPNTSQGEAVNSGGCSETQLSGEGQDEGESSSIPGFGLVLSITAALGAALIAARRKPRLHLRMGPDFGPVR